MNHKICFSVRSHHGCVRADNEDNFHCNGSILESDMRNEPFRMSGEAEKPSVFAVFDGLGGENEGERASFLAASTLRERVAGITGNEPEETDTVVQAYVGEVNDMLCREMRERSMRMGTTMAVAAVCQNEVRCYAIGDSRIYTLQDGRLKLLSRDHTCAASKIEMGVYTEQEARKSGDWHTLTLCLGVFEDEVTVMADVLEPVGIDNPCRILLCSDGLTDTIMDDQIETILLQPSTAEETCDSLVNMALENACRDNVTCTIVDILPIPSPLQRIKDFFTRGEGE